MKEKTEKIQTRTWDKKLDLSTTCDEVIDSNVTINCHNKCVRELIQKRYDLDIIDQHSQTAIMVSVTIGHHKCTGNMIEAGAKINVKDNIGQTAVLKAVIYGRVKCLSKLIMAEVDVSIADDTSQTALMHAAKKGYHAVVDICIKAGSHVNVTDKPYRSPVVSTFKCHAQCVGQTALIKACIYNN